MARSAPRYLLFLLRCRLLPAFFGVVLFWVRPKRWSLTLRSSFIEAVTLPRSMLTSSGRSSVSAASPSLPPLRGTTVDTPGSISTNRACWLVEGKSRAGVLSPAIATSAPIRRYEAPDRSSFPRSGAGRQRIKRPIRCQGPLGCAFPDTWRGSCVFGPSRRRAAVPRRSPLRSWVETPWRL